MSAEKLSDEERLARAKAVAEMKPELDDEVPTGLLALAEKVGGELKARGYKVAVTSSALGTMIQALKGDELHGKVLADPAADPHAIAEQIHKMFS